MRKNDPLSGVHRKKQKKDIVLFVFALACACLLFLPILCSFIASFMSVRELQHYYFGIRGVLSLRFSVDDLTLSQYKAALILNTDFTRALLNSLGLATVSTVFSILLSAFAAYMLAFSPWQRKKHLFFISLALALIPYQAIEIPQLFLLQRMNLHQTDLAIVLTNIFDTVELVLLTVFFSTVSKEQIEAARVDGAGVYSVFFRIVLPQMKHVLITASFLKFVNVWNLTEQPLLFAKDSSHYPLSVLFPSLAQNFSQHIFAFSIIFAAIPLLLYFVVSKSLTQTIEESIERE